MPDGGAVENGALLSVSELEKHGYFVNSLSDNVRVGPVLSNQNKDDDNKKDKMYQPPKHSSALDDEAPAQIYGSDGEELISETEYGHELVRFHIHTYNPESLQRFVARKTGEKEEARKFRDTEKIGPPKHKEEKLCCCGG
jgi:hypothetical protein